VGQLGERIRGEGDERDGVARHAPGVGDAARRRPVCTRSSVKLRSKCVQNAFTAKKVIRGVRRAFEPGGVSRELENGFPVLDAAQMICLLLSFSSSFQL